MIRDVPRLAVGPGARQRRARPAIDAVEAQDRTPRRKRAAARAAGERRAQNGLHGAGPEPVIEVTERHARRDVADHVEQRARLVAALADAQAEMRCDRMQIAKRRFDARADRAPRLAL